MLKLDDNKRSVIIGVAHAWVVFFTVFNPLGMEEVPLAALGVALEATIVGFFRVVKTGEGGEGDPPPSTPEPDPEVPATLLEGPPERSRRYRGRNPRA